jgi:hypothetical protein
MKKRIAFITVCALLLQSVPTRAQDIHPNFNPNILISDTVFSDTQTFGGSDGIQKFLESKGSVLANTNPLFLIKLNEPNDPNLKQVLGDPGYNTGHLRTAAELIWDSGQASGLNPQVILVTLNKEQGLITGTFNEYTLQKALNRAMGFDCPDNTGCGNLFPGFYYQLFGNIDTAGNRYLGAAKSLMKSFNAPNGRGPAINGRPAQVGETITIYNTLGGFTGVLQKQLVTLINKATAALYRYTPHAFNGNYNFWRFFTSWFRYTNGTLVRVSGEDSTYIIQNGERQFVPNFIALARNIDLAKTTVVSPSEMTDYPIGSIYGPKDNTIISVNNAFYVFLNNIKHPVSDFVLRQRNLNPLNSISISPDEAAIFPDGLQLTPSEGTVLKGETQEHIYRVQNGILKRFSLFTLTQYNITKKIEIVPDNEIASYPASGFVPPIDGTLIKGAENSSVYLVQQGQRLPLTEELFKNHGYSFKKVVTLKTAEELSSLAIGTPPPPKDGTYFALSGSKEFYLYKDGAKHFISSFTAKQRKIIPDYSFEASIAAHWPDGIMVPPLDGTLVKAYTAHEIYLVHKGQLQLVPPELFKNLKLKQKNIVILPDAEIEALPTDGYAEPAENTYFSVSETKEFYLFRNGEKNPIFPLVKKQRSMTPDVVFSQKMAHEWNTGSPLMPREYTILKGDVSKTVYLVLEKKLRPLTATAVKRRGYTAKKIITVPQNEIDTYPKGAIMTK